MFGFGKKAEATSGEQVDGLGNGAEQYAALANQRQKNEAEQAARSAERQANLVANQTEAGLPGTPENVTDINANATPETETPEQSQAA
jgi:hypothetical protein